MSLSVFSRALSSCRSCDVAPAFPTARSSSESTKSTPMQRSCAFSSMDNASAGKPCLVRGSGSTSDTAEGVDDGGAADASCGGFVESNRSGFLPLIDKMKLNACSLLKLTSHHIIHQLLGISSTKVGPHDQWCLHVEMHFGKYDMSTKSAKT